MLLLTAVKTVDGSRLFSAKEDKVGSINRKVHGIGVLGYWRHLLIDYLEKGKTITGEYYCKSFNQTRRKYSWEKTHFAKEKRYLSSGQCTRPQKCFGNGKIKESALWIVGTSTLFPRFGSLWLLSLPKTQTLPRWSAFFLESRGDCSCRGYFADLTKNHYRDGIIALENRWNKCISLKWDYIQK